MQTVVKIRKSINLCDDLGYELQVRLKNENSLLVVGFASSSREHHHLPITRGGSIENGGR